MATVLTKLKPNAAKFDAKLNAELDSAARRLKFTDYLQGGLMLAVVVLGYTLLAVIADRLFDLPWELRLACFLLFLGAFIATAWRMVVRPALRTINPRYTARALDRTSTTQENAVINWVDLKDANVPDFIRMDVGRQAATDLATTDKSKLGESPRLKVLGIAAVVLIVGLAGFAVFVKSAPFFSLLRRAYDPLNAGAIALRTEISLEEPAGGNVTITAGESLTVRVRIRGTEPDADGPDRVRLLVRYNPESDEADVVPLERVGSSSEWALKLTPSVIQNGFRYRVVAGDGGTPEYAVTVRTRPLLRDFAVKYEYPTYTRLKPEEVSDARLEGYRGTLVTLTARSNRPLREAKMLFDQQSVQPKGEIGGVDKDEVTFRFPLEESGSYRIQFQPDTDEPSETTAPFPMRVIVDQKPTIQVTLPKDEEIALPLNGLFAVDAQVADDFGITGTKLRFRLAGTPVVPLMQLKYRAGKEFKRIEDGSYPLNLVVKMSVKLTEMRTARGDAFPLAAGTVVEYRLEASDNCTTPSPNIGETPWRRIRIGEAATEQKPDPMNPNKQSDPNEQQRKDDERKHGEQQDRDLNAEKREPQQPRPDQAGDKKPDDQAGDKKPDDRTDAKPNEETKPGTETKTGGENSNKNPMPGDQAKPNEEKPNEGDNTKPKPGDGTTTKEDKPKPDAETKPKTPEAAQKDRDLQKEAERLRDELAKADEQPGKPKSTGADEPRPEAKPGEAKSQPKNADGANEKSDPKPMPKDGTSGEQPGTEKPQPKPGETSSESKPSETPDGTNPKPMGEEKKPVDGKPQSKPGSEKPKDNDAGKPESGKPQQGEAKPKPSDGTGDKQPGESKPQPGEPKAKPGEEAEPKPGEQGGDKTEPKPGEAKPMTPPKSGEAKPKPGDKPDQQPGGDAKPGDDKTEAKPSGEQKPQPSANGKPGDKPDPKEKPAPGAGKPNDAARKLDPKEIEQAAKDLNDPDPKKQQDAREKLDAAMGKENREKAEAKAKQVQEDLKSKDPATKAAAEKELKDLQEQMKKDQDQQGEKSPETGGKPNAKQPTPEQLKAAKKTLEDLNSKDDAKRKAAEDQADQAVGKEAREQLQQDLKDAQSDNPMKAEAAKKRLEEQAKKNAEEAKKSKNPPRGPSDKPDTPGDRLKDDARNRLKTAELQLERFEKAKADKELQKKLGYTPEQYEEFLKGYRAMVDQQQQEVKKLDSKPNEGPRGPSTINVGEGAGKSLEKRPDAGTGPAAGGVGTAPPGYTEAQRKFAEDAAKLKKPEPKK